MKSFTVYSKDILHALPTFPQHEGRSYTAVVTGANGITGAHIVQALAGSPQRWKRVYALSRRPPHSKLPDNVTGVAADFLKSPEDIAQALGKNGVTACVWEKNFL
jgi:NAD(P)-dependent dehydrogenase (short-subunit alcohol dehydrogenase family)